MIGITNTWEWTIIYNLLVNYSMNFGYDTVTTYIIYEAKMLD